MSVAHEQGSAVHDRGVRGDPLRVARGRNQPFGEGHGVADLHRAQRVRRGPGALDGSPVRRKAAASGGSDSADDAPRVQHELPTGSGRGVVVVLGGELHDLAVVDAGDVVQGTHGGQVGLTAAAVPDRAGHPVDAVEAHAASLDLSAAAPGETSYGGLLCVVVDEQGRAVVGGFGEQSAVVHPRSRGITGRPGRRVQHENGRGRDHRAHT